MRDTFANRSVGAGLIGLSCILSSAAAFPARGQERDTSPPSPNERPLLPDSSPDSEAISSAIKDLLAGIVRFSELPHSLQHNETVLVAAINKSEEFGSVLRSLTYQELDSQAVRKAIRNTSALLNLDDPAFASFWTTLFSHPTARDEIIPELVKQAELEPSLYLYSLLKITEAYAPKDLALALREQTLQRVKLNYLASDGSNPSKLRPPALLLSDREVTSHYIEIACKRGKLIPFDNLLDYGLQESEAINVYERLKANPLTEFDQLIYKCPDKLLLGSWKDDYVNAIKQGLRPALGRLNAAVIGQPEIAQATIEIIEAHPELMNALRKAGIPLTGLGEDHPFVQDLHQRILGQEKILDKIIDIIGTDFSTIDQFPDVILRAPRIRLGVQRLVNDKLYERGGASLPSLFGYSTPPKLRFPSPRGDKYMQMFPELISLMELDYRGHDSQLFLYNPGALLTLIRNSGGRTIPEHFVRAFLKAQEAGKALGIFEFGRFDNTYEIIRNRYQVATTETQSKLRLILGEDYFKDLPSIEKPLCVVINPSWYNDHNGAFLSDSSSTYNPDIIDSLTVAYHVLYFEASDEVDLIKLVASTCSNLDKKIDLLILGGHGSSTSISLGMGNYIFDGTSGRLGVEDLHLLSLLSPVVRDEAIIILESCSTAGGAEDEESVAEIVHRAIPHAHVYGPKSKAATGITFGKDGAFEKLDYIYSRQVHLSPSGNTETESQLSSLASDLRLHHELILRELYYRPLAIIHRLLCAIGVVTAVGIINKKGRSLVRRVFGSRKDGKKDSDKVPA